MARASNLCLAAGGGFAVYYTNAAPADTLYNIKVSNISYNGGTQPKLDLIAALLFRVKRWNVVASYSARRSVTSGTSVEQTTSSGSIDKDSIYSLRDPATAVLVDPDSADFVERLLANKVTANEVSVGSILELYENQVNSRNSELTGTYDYVDPIDGPVHQDLDYADKTIDGVLYPYADIVAGFAVTAIYVVPRVNSTVDIYAMLAVNVSHSAIVSQTHLYTDNVSFGTVALGSTSGMTLAGYATFNIPCYYGYEPGSTSVSSLSFPMYISNDYDTVSCDIEFTLALPDAVLPYGRLGLSPHIYSTFNRIWGPSGTLEQNPITAVID